MSLSIRKVYHQFGPRRILHNINLEIPQGSFTAIVGKSGCGKSTLFQAILGTHHPSQGWIQVVGKEVLGPSREVGIVYQQYSLCPFLTSEQNVALGLKLDQTSIPYRLFRFFQWRKKRKRDLELSRELLTDVGLGQAFQHYPKKLSGGMRQRVAIAQALIMRPKVLLLDEPFGALDEGTRESLQSLLLELYQENLVAKQQGQVPPYTVILVTHELNEAFYLADRVVGLSRFWKKDAYRGVDCGATIIFDQVAPVFHPNDPRDFSRFAAQKQLLREVVFDENESDPEEHVTFWNQVAEGNGSGVVQIAKER